MGCPVSFFKVFKMTSNNNPYGQKDFLQECLNSVNVESTVNEFKQAFCSVCANSQCTRSRWADSKWMRRMMDQKESLHNPIFLDPDTDELFKQISDQNFITISQETSKLYGGWVDIKEDGSVVHHADPPTQTKSSDKMDETVSSLKKGSSQDPSEAPDSDEEKDGDERPLRFQPPEESLEKDLPVKETESLEEPLETPEDLKEAEVPKKPTKTRTSHKNTPEPSGGIILGPKDNKKKPSVLLNKEDKWKAPSDDDGKRGKLKVRIGDGTVVKKD